MSNQQKSQTKQKENRIPGNGKDGEESAKCGGAADGGHSSGTQLVSEVSESTASAESAASSKPSKAAAAAAAAAAATSASKVVVVM